jgi:hypothetical protein
MEMNYSFLVTAILARFQYWLRYVPDHKTTIGAPGTGAILI